MQECSNIVFLLVRFLGFLEKNRDAISFDIIMMVDESTNKLLHQIFEEELSANGVKTTKNSRVIIMSRNTLRVWLCYNTAIHANVTCELFVEKNLFFSNTEY